MTVRNSIRTGVALILCARAKEIRQTDLVEPASPKEQRRSATIALSLIVVVMLLLTGVGALLILAGLAATGTSELGLFFWFLVLAPLLAVLSGFGVPQFVLRQIKAHNDDPAIAPTSDGILISFALIIWLSGLGLAAFGAFNGFGSSSLKLVAFWLLVPVGLYTVRELLYRRWSKAGSSRAAIAGLGFLGLVLIAALPSLLLELNPYRELPLAVIDTDVAADDGWTVRSVEDFAPDNVRFGLINEEGGRVTVLIDEASPRCVDQYECSPSGETSMGSPIIAIGRDCSADEQVWPNVLVERSSGHWRVQSSQVRRFCYEEGTTITTDDLIEVANLLIPATVEELQSFDVAHS